MRRSYDRDTQQLTLKNAELDTLPSLANGESKYDFFNLRQMRVLGVDAGELKTVKLEEVENFETVCQIAAARRDKPKLTAADVAVDSKLYKGLQNTLLGSGHMAVKVDVEPGRTEKVSDVFKFWCRTIPGRVRATTRSRAGSP